MADGSMMRGKMKNPLIISSGEGGVVGVVIVAAWGG